ncbi:MAG: hypothetical protein JWM40_2641, partial [Frankiales bacterium]|nr:hypothetical protein [Frankiales bacterium]
MAAAVGIAGAAVAVVVATSASARWNEAAVAAFIVVYAAVGMLILWHRPHEPVGRIAIWSAPAMGLGEALVAAAYAVLRNHPDDRLAGFGSVIGSFLRGDAWLVLVLWLPLRFPHGAGTSTRLRRVATRFVLVTLVGFSLVALLSPTLTDLRVQHIDNPIGLPSDLGPAMDALAGINLLAGAASLCLAVACLIQQYRHGDPLGRQQTLIFGLAFLPPLAAFAASGNDAAGPWLFGVASLPLPIAIGWAILQRRLYDLPLVLNRSVTYGSLWLAIAALYAVVVGGVGAMLRQQGAAWLPWLAAGVVAVTFAPLRDTLQRAANRLTFGQWSQPAEVLARTARRLADAGDVHALLDSLSSEHAVDLGLGYVEINNRAGTRLAAAGSLDAELDELPLTAYGEVVGVLRWARRPLRDSDRDLLSEVAGQLGTIVHADGLLASVRAAQERLVLAREEERRRLRRDLHDGLGPSLAALTLQVDTLRNTLPASSSAQAGLLGLRGHIQDTVVDVRRIVEGLQPATLDDLGLLESVRQLTDRFAREGALRVDVEPQTLPRLPAAVEVGA